MTLSAAFVFTYVQKYSLAQTLLSSDLISLGHYGG